MFAIRVSFPPQKGIKQTLMTPKLPLKTLVTAAAVYLASTGLLAQEGCTNTSQYPSTTTAPGAVDVETQISTCNFLSEYSAVGPVVAGTHYRFKVTSIGYITVREGSSTGTVIAQGFSPVVATPTTDGTLYVHWTVDAACNTASGCHVTSVTVLDCLPPVAAVSTLDDCDNNQFTVNVNVTGLGDGPSVDLLYSVNNGPAQTFQAGIAIGTYNVGPFTIGDLVDITLTHGTDSICNVHFNGLVTQNTCTTIIDCGGAPLDQTYCYNDNDNNHWHYLRSIPGLPLIIIFSAGTIESATYDHLRIYDGPDNTGTLLYDHTQTSQEDLTGLQVVAPSGEIWMENSSDGSSSCASGGQTAWAWVVGCLDCNPAEATYTVNTDCDAQTFTIDVNLTALGSDPTLDITNNAGAPTVTATATGTYTVGPFPITTLVTLTLVNDNNSLCNVVSPVLTNPLCPTHITCGQPALQQAYCYTNNDTMAWHWQNTDPNGTLAMLFSAGSIDFPGQFGDNLRIYDGATNAAPLLYQNAANVNLADLFIQSTGPDIYMEMTSTGFGSCSDGNQTEWQWQVGCYDCAPPAATYTVNTDCDAQSFTVEVHITDMGSQGSLDITNDAAAATITVTDTGMYTVGPFPITTLTTITLENDTNSLCSVHSPVLTNPLCETIIPCGGAPLDQTYCYTNYDTAAWSWGSSAGEPLILVFSAGWIESAFSVYDHIRIYNGTNNTAPLLYENTVGVSNLAGVQAIAPSGHLYMEMTSDVSGSCNGSSNTAWVWQVSCLDCVPPEATYNVVTNCDSMQFSVEVNISLLGSDPVLDITNDGGALPQAASATGTYTVGPFAAGDTVVITLSNDMNTLCSVHSVPLTNPLCPTIVSCGSAPLPNTYCYTNQDHHEWHWQSSGGQPLAIQFSAGTIESQFFAYDSLLIYDGVNSSGTLLYQTTVGANNLAGLLQIASSGDLYMRVNSEFSGSCQDGSQTAWAWDVGCLDCTNPAATYSVVEDCIHHAFSIDVNVDSTGSSPVVRIANSLNTDTLQNVPAGITTVGPFPMDSVVSLTVMNETNSLCRVFSPQFTAATTNCVDSVCAAEAYEYCYTNNDTAWFLYQGTANVPLTIEFLWGHMGAGDFVQIYNGSSPIVANLLWQGNLNGNMAGFAINSTNPQHSLLMRVVSNGAVSCATGEISPILHWVVQCGAVGVGEIAASDFSMYPNPTTGQLMVRLPDNSRGAMDLRITDLAGRVVHHELFNASGAVNTFDLKGLVSGNYTVTLTTNDWVKSQQLQIIH